MVGTKGPRSNLAESQIEFTTTDLPVLRIRREAEIPTEADTIDVYLNIYRRDPAGIS